MLGAVSGCEGRCIQGIVSAQTIDRAKEIMDIDTLYPNLIKMLDRKMAPITVLHKPKIVGRWLSFEKTMIKSESGDMIPAIRAKGKLFDDGLLANEIWKSIGNREMQGLSIGGVGPSDYRINERGGVDKYLISKEAYEVSLVPRGAVREAILEAYNSQIKCDNLCELDQQKLGFIPYNNTKEQMAEIDIEKIKAEVRDQLKAEMDARAQIKAEILKELEKDNAEPNQTQTKNEPESDIDKLAKSIEQMKTDIVAGISEAFKNQIKGDEAPGKGGENSAILSQGKDGGGKGSSTKGGDKDQPNRENQIGYTDQQKMEAMEAQIKSLTELISGKSEKIEAPDFNSIIKAAPGLNYEDENWRYQPESGGIQDMMKSAGIMAHPGLDVFQQIVKLDPKNAVKKFLHFYKSGRLRGYPDHNIQWLRIKEVTD